MTRRLAWLLLLASACGAESPIDGTPDAMTGVQPTFTSLYGDYFQTCKNCHTPAGPGRADDTEMTLNFTTRETAYTTITTGMASGLMGNFVGCNGVPFVRDAMPSMSLILAALDQPTRIAFDDPSFPDCDMDTIADQTLKSNPPPSAAFITALKEWLQDGAPNN
jgi:hypothetical protein